MPADDLKPSIARLTEMVERMDRALQDAPWLAGDEVSLADIDIAPFVQRLVRVDLFGLVAARPRVNDWYRLPCVCPTGVFADAAHHGLIEDSKTLKGRS